MSTPEAKLAAQIERTAALITGLNVEPTYERRRGLSRLVGALRCLRGALALGYSDDLGARTEDVDASWSELVSAAVSAEAASFDAGLLFNDGVGRLQWAAEWAVGGYTGDERPEWSDLRHRTTDLKHFEKRYDRLYVERVSELLDAIGTEVIAKLRE